MTCCSMLGAPQARYSLGGGEQKGHVPPPPVFQVNFKNFLKHHDSQQSVTTGSWKIFNSMNELGVEK